MPDTFTTFEEALETLGPSDALKLINWALNAQNIAKRASTRYRLKQQMVVRRMKEIAAAKGIDLEELMAGDELAGLEDS